MISLFWRPPSILISGSLLNRLPADRLSNINYGQRNDDDSPTKILALKGIGNGFSNILYFRRKAGEWELYKFEDTSI